MKNFIALDLELEQPNRNTEITDSFATEEKIIQIGWCVFNPYQKNILKVQKYHAYYPHPLSSFIKKLTGIHDEDVLNGVSIQKIYREIVKDREEFDTSRIVCQWGHGDMEKIKEEIGHYDIPWEFGKSGLNVKHLFTAYAMSRGIKHRGGLSKVVSRLGMIWEGRNKHRADVDAINTANIYSFICNKMSEID